jgi:glc operon protein GlcG
VSDRLTPAAWLIGVLLVASYTTTRAEAEQAREREPGGAPVSDVNDAARLFRAESAAAARDSLRQLEREAGVVTVVETVPSLDGGSPAEAVNRRTRGWKHDGLFILIDKKDRKLELGTSVGLRDRVSREQQTAVRDAFLAGFRGGDFDAGLRDGIKEIEKVLRASPKPAATATEAPKRSDGAELVVRDQVHLTLAGARRIIEGAEAKAAEMKLKVNIAVVDDGGHPVCFARMDGARPASGYTALTKATTAATFRQETGPLPKGATAPDPLLNLSLQNAASASGGKITTLFGGAPVVVDGQVIGGVGVGGGTGEQDVEIAKAGVARFLADLLSPAAREGR